MKSHKIKPVPAEFNFVSEEEKLLDKWYSDGTITKYLSKNSDSDKNFSFLDGPITANNPMGVHHGWGRSYKDLWQKYFNLKGFRQRFQNGFDCQGLWVEVEVEKDLGFINKRQIEEFGVDKFIKLCKERVEKFASIQTDQSRRLGYFMDWENSYFTMSDENNYMIWYFLKVCHQNGWIYKGKDSVPWCPRCQTAISQHEMLTEDYKEVVHKSIFLELPIQGRDREFLLIWTTTPWTIPANIAVAVDENLEYALVEGETGDKFWIARNAVERIFGNIEGIIKIVRGKELVGLKYSGPFDHLPAVKEVALENPETFHTVVATEAQILSISPDEGTGLVHTAVSAGSEDFKLGKKLGLPMIPVIDDEATYLDNLGFLSGKNAKKHPELILDYLTSEDAKDNVDWVFNIENYKHRYPACWRCKTELVWVVKEEWYIAMDRPGLVSLNKKTLRQRMKDVAKKIKWMPSFGLDRELDWLTNMHDWLISKPNRYWGLALPIYECISCGHFEVIGSKEELHEKSVEGWEEFEGKSPHKPQIDQVKISCEKCGKIVNRVGDVGNVWLDAGIVPFSTLMDSHSNKLSYTSDKKYWSEWFPADFITESFPGQFKNWFYSMIAMSTVLEDTTPFKTVLGYASVLAEDGRPMHKSWGNAIEFNEGASKIGVDVMRWLYARQNPVNNLLFGYKVADEVRRRILLLLWNSYRFYANQASLSNFSPNSSANPGTDLDRWMISRLNSTIKSVDESFSSFDAFHAVQDLELLIQDLSTWYIRRSRDRATESDPGVLSTMHEIFTKLAVIVSPIIPFISDHIYTNLTGSESVHLADWPETNEEKISLELEEKMARVREITERGHSIRKSEGIRVRQPLSSIEADLKDLELSDDLRTLIQEELNVKSVSLKSDSDLLQVKYDLKITKELEEEGMARDIMRDIQKERKNQGLSPSQKIRVELPSWPENMSEEIKTRTNASELIKGSKLTIQLLQ